MLKGISPLLSPDLLKNLSEMGHGDEIVIADAGFPAARLARDGILLRADGVGAADMLRAVLSVLPLDQYDRHNVALMAVVPGDPVEPQIWQTYRDILAATEPEAEPHFLTREAFYERASHAYAIVATGELAQYANILLKKGVCHRG